MEEKRGENTDRREVEDNTSEGRRESEYGEYEGRGNWKSGKGRELGRKEGGREEGQRSITKYLMT